MTSASDEHIRYARQLTLAGFGKEGQQKLQQSKVLIIGVGGLGCPAALYLAAAGVGMIGLMDHDQVGLSNLHRQILYTTGQVGTDKVTAASKQLSKLNPLITVLTHPVAANLQTLYRIIPSYDVILDCTDNFTSRYLINDACVELEKPLVYGSVHRFEGQVAVFNVNGSGHYRHLFPQPPTDDAVPNCEQEGVLGAVAGVIGCMQALEAIKFIAQIGELLTNKLLVYNGLSGASQVIRYQPDVHSEHTTPATKTSTVMVKEISVQELKQMMDDGESFQLIDVREPYETEIATLDGMLIPLGDIADNTGEIATDKKVIVHCRSGARSAKAVQFLQDKLQHQNIYNLKGGILAWANEIDNSMDTY